MFKSKVGLCGIVLSAMLLAAPLTAEASPYKVSITNLSPDMGTFLTPVWVGVHDGTFDLFDTGSAASASLERLAEDGNPAPIRADFATAAGTGPDAVLMGTAGPVAPGETANTVFNLDGANLTNRYLSFASMVIPSNDAFIANDNPLQYALFDTLGNFSPLSFIVLGAQVLDAGTEVNDELPANTAFFGQTVPNTGVDELSTIGLHAGFMPAGSGGILDASMFAAADFLAAGYQVAQITVSRAVPEPAALGLFLAGLLGLGACGIRSRRHLA